MPEISVIIPVYKAEQYLARCVESILNQSYSDFELILVNDGSPDRSGEMCEQYAGQDSRIRVFHKENGGQATARNLAIDWVLRNSDSHWFAFIDSDDWVHKDYLEVLMELVNRWNVKVATCNFCMTSTDLRDEPVDLSGAFRVDAETAMEEYCAMCMSPCCKLYARELFADLRFREGKRYEDAFITHIPVLEAGTIAILNEPLYYYYENPQSSTRKKWDIRNLDQIEAYETRAQYCLDHGYQKAYRTELHELVISRFTQMVELSRAVKEDPSCRKYLRELRPTLLPALRLARAHGLMPFNKKYLWIYEIAYPVKPLWVLRNLLEKYFGLDFPK